MKIVYMGTPDFAVRPLKSLVESGYEVCAVFTSPDRPRGRSGRLCCCEVKEAAVSMGLPVIQPEKLKSPEVLEKLEELAPDVIVVAAYGYIIPDSILTLPKYGCINIHASLLPAYRGAAPVQWAVLNGEKVSGVTIMRVDTGLDTGDIIARQEVVLSDDETSESLFEKLSECGAHLLTDTLKKIEDGTAVFTPQPRESTTAYARMIKKQDGRIDWTRTACELSCFVRGMNPWPCAYDVMNGKNIRIWKAVPAAESTDKAPGTVVKADRDGLYVQTGEGCLSVLELQAEGKKRMGYDEFLRGSGWKRGISFG